jgi:DHA2 family multidrug resistance protein
MLDSYSAQDRGSAMAIWGIGVMLGPIMGPTLGAWLTDNYSWHWVFFINLPVGILTVLGLTVFMQDTPRGPERRFDWFGFAALAIGIGSLQMMLDRGEELGWFGSAEIIGEATVAATGFYYFLAHSLTANSPFVRMELFRDRNFVFGCVFMVVIGVVLFGTMALVTPFMQNVVGYPIVTAGVLLASRGVGTLVAMIMVGRLLKVVEARYLVLTGLTLATFTLNRMVGFTDQTSSLTIVEASIVQGFGLGLVFVPLSTVAFMTLPGHLRTEGSAILTLVRNLGSSVGISIVIAQLTNDTIRAHAYLANYVTPFNGALQAPEVSSILSTTSTTGRAMLEALLTQQASIIAYANVFKLLMYLTLATIPLVFFIGSSRMPRPSASSEPAHALD